jgi:hypothetical protein
MVGWGKVDDVSGGEGARKVVTCALHDACAYALLVCLTPFMPSLHGLPPSSDEHG